MKTCTKCKTTKPLDGFYRDKRRGHTSRCKLCRNADLKAYIAKNRGRENAKERDRYAKSPAKWERHLRNKYGIDAAAYAALLANQGGCCAICRSDAKAIGETLAVDHDHVTGLVRGLLCAKCNRMLGCAIDRPEVLRAGADYLNAQAAQAFIESYCEARGLTALAEAA
jgi:hypothetical protein